MPRTHPLPIPHPACLTSYLVTPAKGKKTENQHGRKREEGVVKIEPEFRSYYSQQSSLSLSLSLSRFSVPEQKSLKCSICTARARDSCEVRPKLNTYYKLGVIVCPSDEILGLFPAPLTLPIPLSPPPSHPSPSPPPPVPPPPPPSHPLPESSMSLPKYQPKTKTLDSFLTKLRRRGATPKSHTSNK